MSAELNISPNLLRHRLRNNGFRLKSYTEAFKLAGNSNWKGGRHIRKDESQVFIRKNGKQRLEHLEVWEENFGKLPKGFVIHHLNLDATDNNIDNLMLIKIGDHLNLHKRFNQDRIRNDIVSFAD